MTFEFPPPDTRLADKVKMVRLEPKARGCNGSDCRGGEFSCNAVNEGQAAIDVDAEIGRLAKLKTLDYERERKEAAKRSNVRPSILDRLIAKRHEFDDDGKQGRTLSLREPEPWPDPINGAVLLGELSAAIRRHVVMPDWAAETAAIWAAHTLWSDASGFRRDSLSHPPKRVAARRRC
jgi:hypothetical protein